MAARVSWRGWLGLGALLSLAAPACFQGEFMLHLACRDDDECLGYRCIDGFCGGPPASTSATDSDPTGSSGAPTGTGGPASCGDGVVDPGEQCDGQPPDPLQRCIACELVSCPADQRPVDASYCPEDAPGRDDCLRLCVPTTCGDGVLNYPAEKCDDGNLDNTDACLSTCRVATCGDGFVRARVELCDDGNTVVDDGCDERCTVATCGDGLVQLPEQCDDGNPDDTDACNALCLTTYCGDGIQQGMEACDDGNTDNHDGCVGACVPALCGDGFVRDELEECDDGLLAPDGPCVPGCRIAVCGDGFVHEGVEPCDDPIFCPDCVPNTCGDGELDPFEECDDGNTDNTDGCTELCQLPACGDGFVQPNELCDDPQLDVIGCSHDCQTFTPLYAVEAGAFHTCALDTLGNIRCWGRNLKCQLGLGLDGSVGDDEVAGAAGPLDLAGAIALQVAPGGGHTCALLDDGMVRCWGANNAGQLGLADTFQRPCATNVPSQLPDVWLWPDTEWTQAIAAGERHTCALSSQGNVRCWGDNDSGQLGQGNVDIIGDDEHPIAAPLVDIGGFGLQIAAGGHNTCVVRADGQLRCWGRNLSGSLGYGVVDPIGDDEPLATFGDVSLPDVVATVALGAYHTCANLQNGASYCWGRNVEGALGLGFLSPHVSMPAETGMFDVKAFRLGASFTCALRVDGGVRCWGAGKEGQLASGDDAALLASQAPDVAFVPGLPADLLAAGNGHACARLSGEGLRCWGLSYDGQLGYGTTTNLGDEPGEVPLFSPVFVFGPG